MNDRTRKYIVRFPLKDYEFTYRTATHVIPSATPQAGTGKIDYRWIGLAKATTNGDFGLGVGFEFQSDVKIEVAFTVDIASIVGGRIQAVIEKAPYEVWCKYDYKPTGVTAIASKWLGETFKVVLTEEEKKKVIKSTEEAVKFYLQFQDITAGINNLLNKQVPFIFPGGTTFYFKDPTWTEAKCFYCSLIMHQRKDDSQRIIEKTAAQLKTD